MGAIDTWNAFLSENVAGSVGEGLANEWKRTREFPVMLGREGDNPKRSKVDRCNDAKESCTGEESRVLL